MRRSEHREEQLVRLFEDSRGPGKCRGCGADVEWYETVAGKRMPMDAGAVPRKSETHQATGRVLVFMAAAESHFNTCPKAKDFQRR